ncbi:hypothetical protein [Aureivirga marina]|uniref:hypothetical protein n=1 Tax=Aureivirga marina TaxID=1182451 RepID=UPI0018C92AEC|nr:hypothetical protein [Aureivirga marina]
MKNNFRVEFEDGETKTANVKIKPPKDIVQFVAGTTDPVNIQGLKHQANKDYWRGTDNLWNSVKNLKPQYLDLHIEDTFFSWSGDNNTDARTKAAERLLDLLLRVYSNWTKKEIHLHLIGHSHGGNVINQFTELISSHSDFPTYWKVKSITYLSTPFFKEQHQLNHAKLHEDCKIINVHNEYDITQRFVADYTLKNLEYLIDNLQDTDKIKKAVENLRALDMSAYEHLTDININNHTEGPAIWRTTNLLLIEIETILKVVVQNIDFIGKKEIVSPEKTEFLAIMNELLQIVSRSKTTFLNNRQNREGGYGRSEFFEDLELIDLLRLVNRVIEIRTNEDDSYLLNFLHNVLAEEENGLLLKIDDTSWTPEKQVKGKFTIEDFNITKKDLYHSRNRKSNFERFATGIENAMKRNDERTLKEILMRLVSQFVNPADVERIISGIGWLEYIIFGQLDAQAKEVRRNLTVYNTLITAYHADLITEEDANNEALEVKPGSIPYLAMTSHSLSHTSLFDDADLNVRKALTDCFSSGKNPGYKPK